MRFDALGAYSCMQVFMGTVLEPALKLEWRLKPMEQRAMGGFLQPSETAD